MLIRKNNILVKSAKIFLLVSGVSMAAITAVSAGDAVPLPDDGEYEASLLKDSNLYPDVGLRKKVSANCYCGAYFAVSGGYAFGAGGTLSKGSAIEVATGAPANVQPAIVNPGIINEAIPSFNMKSRQYVGTVAAGYKFGNFRVEVAGEYRYHIAPSSTTALGTGSYKVRGRTQQYGALMSAFYDVDIPNLPIVPYVGIGAGLALSNTKYSIDYTNAGTTTSGSIDFSKGASFMGAAMAGVAFKVTNNITLDVGYKFLNIAGGTATYEGHTNGANINTAAGANLVNPSGMGLRADTNDPTIIYKEVLDYPSFTSHEVKAGIRYTF